MNKAKQVISLCVVAGTLSNCANPVISGTGEKNTDAVFAYLASRRSMNVLRAGGEQLGAFGSVYTLLDPATNSKLYSMARKGRPIDISPYDPAQVELPKYTVETTSYQIQSQLASEIGADVKAEVETQGGNINLFKKKLVASNVKFKVTRVSTYEKPARTGFATHIYKSEELPPNSNAIITPLEILVVTDFTYDHKADDSVEGKLVAKFIENLQADIKVAKTSNSTGSFTMGEPGKSVEPRIIAIRPLVLAHNKR